MAQQDQPVVLGVSAAVLGCWSALQPRGPRREHPIEGQLPGWHRCLLQQIMASQLVAIGM